MGLAVQTIGTIRKSVSSKDIFVDRARWDGVFRARVLTNRNPVTNETILDGWAESTSHDTECVTGTPCPTSVKNISFVTEWLRLGKSYREVSSGR